VAHDSARRSRPLLDRACIEETVRSSTLMLRVPGGCGVHRVVDVDAALAERGYATPGLRSTRCLRDDHQRRAAHGPSSPYAGFGVSRFAPSSAMKPLAVPGQVRPRDSGVTWIVSHPGPSAESLQRSQDIPLEVSKAPSVPRQLQYRPERDLDVTSEYRGAQCIRFWPILLDGQLKAGGVAKLTSDLLDCRNSIFEF